MIKKLMQANLSKSALKRQRKRDNQAQADTGSQRINTEVNGGECSPLNVDHKENNGSNNGTGLTARSARELAEVGKIASQAVSAEANGHGNATRLNNDSNSLLFSSQLGVFGGAAVSIPSVSSHVTKSAPSSTLAPEIRASSPVKIIQAPIIKTGPSTTVVSSSVAGAASMEKTAPGGADNSYFKSKSGLKIRL
jgi:hypothetical protein